MFLMAYSITIDVPTMFHVVRLLYDYPLKLPCVAKQGKVDEVLQGTSFGAWGFRLYWIVTPVRWVITDHWSGCQAIIQGILNQYDWINIIESILLMHLYISQVKSIQLFVSLFRIMFTSQLFQSSGSSLVKPRARTSALKDNNHTTLGNVNLSGIDSNTFHSSLA